MGMVLPTFLNGGRINGVSDGLGGLGGGRRWGLRDGPGWGRRCRSGETYGDGPDESTVGLSEGAYGPARGTVREATVGSGLRSVVE
jgi:hypothetical protein